MHETPLIFQFQILLQQSMQGQSPVPDIPGEMPDRWNNALLAFIMLPGFAKSAQSAIV
jgi:hypothetical protein